MNRYSSEIFSALHNATTKPDNIKPLQLTINQFYDFMLQRRLSKTRYEISKRRPLILFDLLETEDTNPLSVYMYPNMACLPEGSITWSINEYV